MEKQRSFSIKPTRFLVFSFTICFSLIFLTFFSIWVIKTSPSIHQETLFQFNNPFFSSTLKTVQTFTNFSASEVRNAILFGSQLKRPENESEIGIHNKAPYAVNGNLTVFSGNSVNNSVLMSTHVKKPEITSGYVEDPVFSVNNSVLRDTHVKKTEITSGFEKDSVFSGSSSVLRDTHVKKTKITSGFEKDSVFSESSSVLMGTHNKKPEKTSGFAKDSVLVGTHVKKPEITIGFAKDSVFWGRLRKKNGSEVVEDEKGISGNSSDGSFGNLEVLVDVKEKSERLCDVTKGRWVFDESYPLYRNVTCPFIDEGFSCETNGRLDNDYMKWRWQPQDCDIPRFNATKMLELIRGKRLVFVGDSINRNQWESMLCLLIGAVKDPKRVYETHGRKISKEKGNYCFKFLDFKCTLEYYATHFLVHESKARVGKKRVQTLRIDTMDRGSSRWKGADILIFNTAHWWTHYKTQSGINYYQEGYQVHPRLDVSTAFRKALTTWASWVDKHINPRKTQVFFRSSAPSHFRGGQWNAGGQCRDATRPIIETPNTNYPEKNIITEEVIKQMKIPVTYLNVTHLSDYRIDGHPSIYGRRPEKRFSGGQDCSHWCLPGVPDTWNELLFFHLQSGR